MIYNNRPSNDSTRRIAIGLCGKIYSGKDTVADFLVKKYGFKKYSYSSDVLSTIIKLARGIESREVYISLGLLLGKNFGKYCLDQLLYGKVLNDNCNKIVIPNIRLLSNIEFWKEKSDFTFYLVAISASDEIRFKRWKKASGKKESHTYDSQIKTKSNFLELSRKDFEETDLKKILSAQCFDFTINNDVSLADLHLQIAKMRDQLFNQYNE